MAVFCEHFEKVGLRARNSRSHGFPRRGHRLDRPSRGSQCNWTHLSCDRSRFSRRRWLDRNLGDRRRWSNSMLGRSHGSGPGRSHRNYILRRRKRRRWEFGRAVGIAIVTICRRIDQRRPMIAVWSTGWGLAWQALQGFRKALCELGANAVRRLALNLEVGCVICHITHDS